MSNLQTLLAILYSANMTVILTILMFDSFFNGDPYYGLVFTLSTFVTIGLLIWNMSIILCKSKIRDGLSSHVDGLFANRHNQSSTALIYFALTATFFISEAITAINVDEPNFALAYAIHALIAAMLLTWVLITTLRRLRSIKGSP